MMMSFLKNPQKLFSKRVDFRLIAIILPLVLLAIVSVAYVSSPTTTSTILNPFRYIAPIKSLFYSDSRRVTLDHPCPSVEKSQARVGSRNVTDVKKKRQLDQARIAVCLVGGARRFELTGPSIVQNILNIYPNNSDLFLHSPLDSNAYKFSILKTAPRIAGVRIFRPVHIPETESHVRVLTASGSPNGIQGLLQYFNLVEGCLTMIKSYQQKNNFTYDWIVRTRVDGYWSAPLRPDYFIPGNYLVPPGSSYGGLNDRFGVGDMNTSITALSRLSLIPKLDSAGFRQLNSESAFKAQLKIKGIPCLTKRVPFCVVSDRRYNYPPGQYGVPVAAMSSLGPLSGAKCRPCNAVCYGKCVGNVMNALGKGWSWTPWRNGSIELCNAHEGWQQGWEDTFDANVGDKLTNARKEVVGMKLEECVAYYEEMRKRAGVWDAPPAVEICGLGLISR